LTGATGKLGRNILDELSNYDFKIYCLVRNKNNLPDLKNVEYIESNLANKNLGVSHEIYQHLASTIDLVIHSAANVNSILPYQSLKEINVDTVKYISEFCFARKLKFLSFVSTLSIFLTSDFSFIEVKEVFPENMTYVNGGYDASKFVAEIFAINTFKNSPNNLKIFRPSLLVQEDDRSIHGGRFVELFFRGLEIIGQLPEEALKLELNCIDTQIVAKKIASESIYRNSNTFFHICEPQNRSLENLLSTNYNWLKLKIVSIDEFKVQLKSLMNFPEIQYLNLSLLQIYEPEIYKNLRGIGLFQATGYSFPQ